MTEKSLETINVFDSPDFIPTSESLTNIQKYVANLRRQAEDKPDQIAEALYLKAAIKQAELNLNYFSQRNNFDDAELIQGWTSTRNLLGARIGQLTLDATFELAYKSAKPELLIAKASS